MRTAASRSILSALLALCACGGDSTPGGGGPGSNITPDPDLLALEKWKTTMTLADFHTANMSQAWSTMMTTDGQLCISCHTEYGSSDEQYFFDMVVQDQEILLRFFAVANAKVSVNDASFNTAATHMAPVPMHPPFDPSTAIGLMALRQFYTLTCGHDPSLCP